MDRNLQKIQVFSKKQLSPRNTMYSEVTIVSNPGVHA